MAGLAGVPGGAEPRLAAEDHAEPDPDLAGHEQQVGDAGVGTAPVFAEGAEVGLVGDRHRDAEAEARRQQVAERHVAPTEIGGEVDESVGRPGDADDGDADPGEAMLLRERAEQRLGEAGDVVEGLGRGEPAAGRSTRTRLNT